MSALNLLDRLDQVCNELAELAAARIKELEARETKLEAVLEAARELLADDCSGCDECYIAESDAWVELAFLVEQETKS